MIDGLESPHERASESGGKESRLSFTLKHWYLWQSDEVPAQKCWPCGRVLPFNGGRADVGFLPMMQRRRLSPLARAACAVAWHGREAAGDMPTVFFSRHGESQYYFEMLQDMAAGEGVSPSRFSLCVHNAIAGLFSVQSESFQPYTALAGGTEGLFAAFIEAAGLLLEVAEVMVVCYEQPLPEAYRPYVPTTDNTWALAMVLAKASGSGYQLGFVRKWAEGAALQEGGQPSLVRAILSGQLSGHCEMEQVRWAWSLDHA